LLDRDALGAGDGGPSRSEGIAGHHEIVGNGAALNVILGAPRAVGNDFAFLVSIFGGVAVDENGGSAFALGGEGFESAIAVRIRVADEDDFAFDVDALFAEKIVVFGIAAVGIDERGCDLAGGGHAAPCRADTFVFHVRVAGDGHFAQAGAIVDGCDHFERSELGIAAVNIVAADDDVIEAFVAPLIGDIAGEFVIARGAGDVRLRREDVMLAALFVGGGNGFESGFDLGLVRGGGGSEAEDGSLGVEEGEAKCESQESE
jgi:hypothetical protein